MTAFSPVLLIPHYRHLTQLRNFIPLLKAKGIPILVVDDGSPASEAKELQQLAVDQGFELILRPQNRGKGAAVMSGFRAAAEAGYTHALQIDADGQHEPADIPVLLKRAQELPATLVCGEPVFDEDIPAARKYGRKLTDFFVVLETWTFTLKDSMCGLRVYPLKEILDLLDYKQPGDSMDFDIEVLVFAYWRGINIEFVKTRVRYPETGLSHYHYIRDNLKVTAMHARLLLGMFPRIPTLLGRHFGQSRRKEA